MTNDVDLTGAFNAPNAPNAPNAQDKNTMEGTETTGKIFWN